MGEFDGRIPASPGSSAFIPGQPLSGALLSRVREGLETAREKSGGNFMSPYFDVETNTLYRPTADGLYIGVTPNASAFGNKKTAPLLNGAPQFNYDFREGGKFVNETKVSGLTSDTGVKDFLIGAAITLPAFGAAIAGAGAAPAAAAAPVTESAATFLPAHEMTHAAGFLVESSPGVFAPSLAAVSVGATAAQVFATGKSALGLASAGASIFGGSGGSTAGSRSGAAAVPRSTSPQIVAIPTPVPVAADSVPANAQAPAGFFSTVAENAALIPLFVIGLAAYLGAR